MNSEIEETSMTSMLTTSAHELHKHNSISCLQTQQQQQHQCRSSRLCCSARRYGCLYEESGTNPNAFTRLTIHEVHCPIVVAQQLTNDHLKSCGDEMRSFQNGLLSLEKLLPMYNAAIGSGRRRKELLMRKYMPKQAIQNVMKTYVIHIYEYELRRDYPLQSSISDVLMAAIRKCISESKSKKSMRRLECVLHDQMSCVISADASLAMGGQPVYKTDNVYDLGYTASNWPEIHFYVYTPRINLQDQTIIVF